LLVVWAAFAKIDEVTRGEARVVPTSQVQIIQSVDGGVVEALLVKEGQIVEAGQLLLRVDSTRFVSTMLESQASQTALQAKALRLEALTRGTPFNPPKELVRDAPDVVAQERRLYESRRAEISAQTAIYQSQLVQRQQELNEVRARRDQAERSLALMNQEINATRPMVATGAVSEVEMMRLDQQLARLRGDREQATAQIARVQSAIQEANSKISEVQLTSRNQMSAELSETMSRLASLSQGGVALQDKVKHADIKSPVRGTVKRLLVNTIGAVVQPGKEVVEVVPLDDTLILEVQITPKDIGFLRPGQAAMVKFSAYDYSIYGGLEAEVFLIGADSVLDEKGNAFYHVRVRTLKSSLGPNLPIIPGMVAQVDIMTGKKTVLSYLLKPVLRAKANAMTER
ncbi:MAG: HlyD family type I secretion periplasmic adaptor subunit, partial [Betaproteobacteria bacterium HGW-Betaproteobacteria-18]